MMMRHFEVRIQMDAYNKSYVTDGSVMWLVQ